jgi:hypothetical protein
MSYWNHRVIHKYHEKTDDHTFHIHEVYYDDNGTIEGWTKSPVEPMGKTPNELREEVRYFIKTFQKPILIEKVNEGKEVLVPDEEAPEINEGHYSEFLDRTWVAIDYIYQFLGCHPLMKKEQRLHDIYLKAEKALSELYQEAGKLEIKTNKNSG